MERLKEVLINPEQTIKQVLKHMDVVGRKTMFAVNEENKLLGIVTDGDIRRWILKGLSLNEDISKVMNTNPIFLRENYSKEEAKNLMVLKVIECIPVINEQGQVISLTRWVDFFDNVFKKHKEINTPVVIMAGGQGSRLAPFTNVLPKPLIPIQDKPIIELIIDKFVDAGCKAFYLSVNYKANLLKAYFSDLECNYKINYVQEDMPLGTAGSLFLLKDIIKETFFLSNCDILIEADYSDMLNFHVLNKNKITVVTSMKHYTIPYGVCEIKNGGRLKRVIEKPEYDFFVNSGMYILEPEVLSDIPQKKIYNITDLINSYMKRKEKVGVYPISEKSWIDMGEWDKLQELLKRIGAR